MLYCTYCKRLCIVSRWCHWGAVTAVCHVWRVSHSITPSGVSQHEGLGGIAPQLPLGPDTYISLLHMGHMFMIHVLQMHARLSSELVESCTSEHLLLPHSRKLTTIVDADSRHCLHAYSFIVMHTSQRSVEALGSSCSAKTTALRYIGSCRLKIVVQPASSVRLNKVFSGTLALPSLRGSFDIRVFQTSIAVPHRAI
jgi:hypothetical protein